MTEHPRICQGCGSFGDWRGVWPHHVIHKKMGGRHGQAKVEIEAPSNKQYLCGKCHSAKHGIREV